MSNEQADVTITLSATTDDCSCSWSF